MTTTTSLSFWNMLRYFQRLSSAMVTISNKVALTMIIMMMIMMAMIIIIIIIIIIIMQNSNLLKLHKYNMYT